MVPSLRCGLNMAHEDDPIDRRRPRDEADKTSLDHDDSYCTDLGLGGGKRLYEDPSYFDGLNDGYR